MVEIKFPEFTANKATGGLLVDFSEEDLGHRQSIPLPWSKINEGCMALRPGSVVIVGGPPGFGKTLFCQQIAAWIEQKNYCDPVKGETWYYLPLEDRAADWMRRMLTHLSGEWGMMSDSQAEGMLRAEGFFEWGEKLNPFNDHICENPRLPEEREGKLVSPSLGYKDVLAWIKRACEVESSYDGKERILQKKNLVARIIFIDSLSFVDFGTPAHEGQKLFVRHLTGLTIKYNISVVLVAHTIKRHGAARNLQLSGEDLAGAAEFHRMASAVILLDSHEPKISRVYRQGGGTEEVEHNRTVILDKCRYGRGLGWRIAANLRKPWWEELGVIAHERKEKKNGSPF